jgi:outer membrane biosynthesis protein TonB
MLLNVILLGLAAGLVGRAAAAVPVNGPEPERSGGRSCDRMVVAHADTAVDSKDALLATVRQTNGPLTPPYPADLRSSRISGRVLASFVIDTLGRVPPGGVWIQQETHWRFGQAVCAHLNRAHFTPLAIDGRRRSVRVLNWPTSFEIVPN